MRGFALAGLCLALFASLTAPLPAQEVNITEFMASNGTGLVDGDGDYSDWIELYNSGSMPTSLSGWFLTTSRQNLSQWPFPAVTIPGKSYLVVFASGKNRKDAKGCLHTNFKLDRGGEYLALVQPDGQTSASEYAPAYPRQITDLSYGRAMLTDTEQLVPRDAPGTLLLPADNRLSLGWVLPDFDDTSWTRVTMGIGYDRVPVYGPDPSEPATLKTDVTNPGDGIVATSANSPGNEGVINAIDNSPQTKYLNFDKLSAGLTVTPSAGLSVVTGLRLTSANDAPERDPTSFLLLGSNDGRTFTEIARGPIPGFSGRFVPLEVAFTNSQAYASYRLLFPTVQNAAAAVAVQIAEVELLGWLGASAPSFEEPIRTNLESLMFGRASSVYLRIPFVVQASYPRENLALWMRYDDGVVAFLNGVEVARANAPSVLVYNSVASTNRARGAAMREDRFDLTRFANLIHPGTNILAVQALNDRANSADFLCQVRLENTQITWGPAGYLAAPTPGDVDGAVLAGLVEDVVIDQKRGFYDAPIDVPLFCPTAETTIRFTTNGSVPTITNGAIYKEPLRLARTTCLRAAAFRQDWQPSRVATRTFMFLNDVITQDRVATLAAGFPSNLGSQAADYGLDSRVVGLNGLDKYGGKYTRSFKDDLESLPSMSIVMDQNDLFGPQGIYSNPESHGPAWERATSVELIYPDGRDGFQAEAGIRTQGGAFRRFDLSLKKSFRLIFREIYGEASLQYPLFGPGATDHFNNVVLRANSNDAWPYGGGNALYVRDAFAMETARAMGIVASHTSFVHLYLNGLYWGLYNPVERPDAAFSATYHGGDEDSWDAINQDSVPDGNYEAWNRMQALLNQGLTNNVVYQRIQGNNPDGTRNSEFEDLLDTDNMIDYLILNFYIGNVDWPGRNWWVGRNRDGGDGFQFYPWDSETALGLSGVDANVIGANAAVARPYAVARANADFRLRFADHVYRHFFNGGALYVNSATSKWDPAHPENNVPAARLFGLSEQVRRAIVGESARWGDQLNSAPYTRDEHWQKARDNLLSAYFPRRSSNVLAQLRQARLYPQTDAPFINPRGGRVPVGFQVTLTAATGTIYYTTNGDDPRTPVTGVPNHAFTYTAPVTLHDLSTIKARVLNGQDWSALNEATFVVGEPVLALSELQYHPAHASEAEHASGWSNADEFEFIEFWNPGTGTYNLTGVRIVDGVSFDFTGSAVTHLPAGGYVLVVKNRAAFERRYGAGRPIAGEYSGQLDNAGERIELVNAAGETIMAFNYGTLAPWPAAADGAGPSLEVIDRQGDLNSPANWRASQSSGGSPGWPNPPPPIELKGVAQADGHLRFWFDGSAGTSYVLEVRRSLSTGMWETLERLGPAATNQPIDIRIDLETNGASGFYRITRP